MAGQMPALQLRGLLVDDEGRSYRQAAGALGPSQTKRWGEELMQGRRDKAIDRYWEGRVTGDKKMGFLQPDRSPVAPAWDGFSGVMAGVRNAAESQGRTMATSGLATRPSMRSLASGTYAAAPQPANDGWEHPDVRAAKLRILQESGNAMTDARLEHEQERDPGYQDYTRERADQRDAASFDRRAPIYTRQRSLERDADISDVRARATEAGTNPFLVEERDYRRGLETNRASMDALARMFGSMRPETAELFENNPGMLDDMGRRVRRGAGGAPAPGGAVGGGTGVQDEEPDMNDQAASPFGGYENAQTSAELPPVVRAEIEQMLREGRYAVNEKNIMAVYGRMQQQ